MKFIHCSDIHLGRRPVGGIGEYSQKRFEDYFIAFRQIIDRAIEEDVDAVLIAGDLFDRRELTPEILHRTERELQLLIDADIAVVAIEGNHDNITAGKESESWIVYLEMKGVLQRPFYTVTRSDETDQLDFEFTPIVVNGTELFGLGYPGGLITEVFEAFNQFLVETDRSDVVCLVHTAPASGDFLPGVVSHEDVLKLRDRVKYLACGHFHSYVTYPTADPFLFIPGSSEYWDLAEKVGKKGMILFDTESCEHSFIPTEPRAKRTVKLELSEDENIAEKFETLYRTLEIAVSEEILIVEIIDHTNSAIDTEELKQIAENIAKPLRLEINVIRPKNGNGESRRRKEGESIAMVEERIVADWELFGSYKEEVQSTIKNLKEAHRANSGDLFSDSFDQLLSHIISDEEDVEVSGEEKSAESGGAK